MDDIRSDVVISGISGRFPSVDNTEELWHALMAGKDLASPETVWPVADKQSYLQPSSPGSLSLTLLGKLSERTHKSGDHVLPSRRGQLNSYEKFDFEFFNYKENEADLLDPQMRLFLEVVYEAICDAGIRPESLRGSNTAVHIGACYIDVERAILEKGMDVDPFLQVTASRVSYAFDFRGPSFVNDTACASSFSCFNEAFMSIKAGLFENAIIGGLSVHSDPRVAIGFRQLRMISEDGRSKCLDKDVDGYCRSESVVCLFLQHRKVAKRIYANIVGCMTNTDGYKPEGITFPKYETQKKLMHDVLDKYNLDPMNITYIEAHMTGTAAGDNVETNAIVDAYRGEAAKPLYFGCVKSNLGHTEGASGCIAVAKVCLAFQRREIPPNIHFKNPNPNIQPLLQGIVIPILRPTPLEHSIVPVNSFGFGGVNIHAILAANKIEPNENSLRISEKTGRLVNFCGRSAEAVDYALTWIEKRINTTTTEFLDLVNEVSKASPDLGMCSRGFLLIEGNKVVHKEISIVDRKKPLTFIFPCLGKTSIDVQGLMDIEPFSNSIINSASILQEFGYNLHSLMFKSSENIFQKITDHIAFVVALQIAIADTLHFLEIKPQFIAGSSIGEIAAGYADGHLTQREALLVAITTGKCLKNEKGVVTVVTASKESVQNWCQINDEVHIVSCPSEDNIVVAGDCNAVKKLVSDLKLLEQPICNAPLHCPFVRKHYQNISNELSKILKPRKRSEIWISSKDSCQEARTCTADYFAHVLVSPMSECYNTNLLSETAFLVNIGPLSLEARGQDKATILQGPGDSRPTSSTSALIALGKIYNTGHNPAIERLYPTVNYPVPQSTMSISPLIKWSHRKRVLLMKYPDYFQGKATSFITVQIDMTEPKFQYLEGHYIDGRFLYPATAHLSMGWLAATAMSEDPLPHSVEFHDVRFIRVTIVPKVGTLKFNVAYNKTTGKFTVLDGGAICASGYCRLTNVEESVEAVCNSDVPHEEKVYYLQKTEIYKELRVRGYDYGENFQLLEEASTDGRRGKVCWKGNWVNFADCVMHLGLFERKDRLLYVPTSIDYMLHDSKKFLQMLEPSNTDKKCLLDVRHYNRTYVVGDGAIVIKNVKGMQQARRFADQVPEVQKGQFVPHVQRIISSNGVRDEPSIYQEMCRACLTNILNKVRPGHCNLNITKTSYVLLRALADLNDNGKDLSYLSQVIKEKGYKIENDLLVSLNQNSLHRVPLDLAMENIATREVSVVEVNSTADILFTTQLERVQNYSKTFSCTLIHPSYSKDMVHSDIQKIEPWKSDVEFSLHSTSESLDIVIYRDFSSSLVLYQDADWIKADAQCLLNKAHDALKEGGFLALRFREKITAVEHAILTAQGIQAPKTMSLTHVHELARALGFVPIEEKVDNLYNVALLYRKARETKRSANTAVVIKADTEHYEWTEELKKTIEASTNNADVDRIWVVGNDYDYNGVIGFMTCLRKEAKGAIVRCIHGVGAELTEELIERDLVINVHRDGQWGSYRYIDVDLDDYLMKTDNYYLDIQTKGDLSSLKWFQSNVTPIADIYYASLNFKDVMVASGRVPTNAYPEGYDCKAIGIEYSGIDQNNNRICGISPGGSIATGLAEQSLYWNVPSNWSLEDAATIPLVYLTVYYALLFRARLKENESILIHAGSGGVGQAAICLCLKMNCEIYTTVGSQEKRKFLKKRFPKLRDDHIGCSRDLSFEEFILKSTDGKGVDLVLNSLAEEKLRASVRCLANFGRFVEIGKYDIVIDSPFDHNFFGHNRTFHVVCLAHLIHAVNQSNSRARHIMKEIRKFMADDITSGVVQPLERTVFSIDCAEEAFRFMASGKHIGKVLIRMRDENEPFRQMASVPQTFFASTKTYIISGGLGGFGLEVALWMISRGAKALILTSRSGVKDDYQRHAIYRMGQRGARVDVAVNDAKSLEDAQNLVEKADKIGPLGGIFMLNLLLKDGLFEEQTIENFNEVCESKVQPTLNFDLASRSLGYNLDYFVCFSSIAASFGNVAQTNYGFANSTMERICEKRVAQGLHGLAIQWGAIGDVGYVAERIMKSDFVFSGTVSQRIPSCLQILDRLLQSPFAVCSTYLRASSRIGIATGDDLIKRICHVLGIKNPEKLHLQTTLNDLGLDSLMAIEIKQGLEREYDTIMSTQDIRNLTIQDLKDIEKKKQALSTKPADDSAYLDFTIKYLLLPETWYIRLNSDFDGVPIFVFPPIEGDFSILMPLLKYINRPIFGVQWFSGLQPCSTLPEVAAHYVHFMKEHFPLSEFNILGYSFGTAVAFEVAVQLQQLLGATSVKRLLFLDGTPQMLKLQVNESIFFETDNKCVTETFMNYVSSHVKLENLEILKLREELLELPTKEKKADKLADVIRVRTNQKCDPLMLLAAIDRLVCKMKMVHNYAQPIKYVGHAALIRAKDKSLVLPFKTVEEDYGLSQIVDGKTEVVTKEGHHQSFLEINQEEIGVFIESCFNEIYL